MRNIIVIAIIWLFALPSTAQVSRFQALYLVNMAKNLDWGRDQITIGVVGNTKTLLELEKLVSKYEQFRLLKIAGSESVDRCQLIFLPASQSRNFKLIQNKIGNSDIVLVTEDPDLVNQGAEVSFFLEGNKLKFSINQPALESTEVKVSSKLLSVARIVN